MIARRALIRVRSLAFLAIAFLPIVASAQSFGHLSLSGRVDHAQAPAYRPGDRVLVYDTVTNKWIGPSLTDSLGSYAFYDLVAGRDYILRVYVGGRSVSTNQITYAGVALHFDIEVS